MTHLCDLHDLCTTLVVRWREASLRVVRVRRCGLTAAGEPPLPSVRLAGVW